MRIVFVHSPMQIRRVDYRESYWRNFDNIYSYFHSNFQPMRKTLWELPHWVPWLGGEVRESGFQDIGYIDIYSDCGTLEGIDENLIRMRIDATPGDVYLFSPMATNLPEALRVAGIIKELQPRAKTVFGGVVATPLAAELAHDAHVDYVIRDRGEVALPALLRCLASGGDLSIVPNLTTCQGSATTWHTPVAPPKRVRDIAMPALDIIPSNAGMDIRYLRSVYALGCPFTCQFCTIQTIGRSPDYFPVSRVLREIEDYRLRFGQHHHVYFGDETFTLNISRTLELCAALAAAEDITFDCQTRLNCLKDQALFPALGKAGCHWIEIGLESASLITQDRFKQHSDLALLEPALAALRAQGIGTCTFLVLGLPGETLDDMKRTIELALYLISRDLLSAAYISIFVPYPGSPIYKRPAEYGLRLHHRTLSLYHEDLPPVFDSPLVTADGIYELFLSSIQEFSFAMESRAVSLPRPRA